MGDFIHLQGSRYPSKWTGSRMFTALCVTSLTPLLSCVLAMAATPWRVFNPTFTSRSQGTHRNGRAAGCSNGPLSERGPPCSHDPERRRETPWSEVGAKYAAARIAFAPGLKTFEVGERSEIACPVPVPNWCHFWCQTSANTPHRSVVLVDALCGGTPCARWTWWRSVTPSRSAWLRADSFSHVGNAGSTPAGITKGFSLNRGV